ncbi:matrix metalloproteinase-24-like [Formica exsecta]|uniref:matrix metalloproteinase-24-like n=1 Tax=Formica exsecta TaxID=72781 RepID=UPI0011419537|nr:matrix metalloproteinase-24-like [Formica exsecta]
MTVLILAITLVAATTAKPVDSEKREALRFLRAYGFLKDNGGSLSDNATSLRHALSLFQEYYQLSGNGALNPDTLRLMRKPRCGLADIPGRAYSPIARKWPKTRLTWNFQVASEELLKTVEAAFALLWTVNLSLTFARDPLHPDILISYRTGAHTYANRLSGDICPAVFDGSGGALAHAFFPSGAIDFASEVHIDDAEPWHVYLNKNPPDTCHLLQTLTHEMGHTLGLQHSMRNDSVMFPYIPDIENQFPVKLSIEDVLAIQNLYGSHDDGNYPTIPTTTIAPATTTSVAPTDPARADLCALRRIDAALIMNRRLYIANRRNVWSVDITERRYGRPMKLTDYATFLPANLTRLSAAYRRPSGDLALFVNDSIYVAEYPSFKLKLVGVNVSRPSYVEVVLGNCHGKEISFAPDVWKELLDLRSVLTSYFQRDEREEMRPPAPIYIGQLTLRFGKLNNLRILRLETPKDRLVASRSTVLNILNLEHCINRIITTLSGLTGYIDNKLTRFLDIAADVRDRTLIPTAIRDSENFDRNDIIDCELQALLFGES